MLAEAAQLTQDIQSAITVEVSDLPACAGVSRSLGSLRHAVWPMNAVRASFLVGNCLLRHHICFSLSCLVVSRDGSAHQLCYSTSEVAMHMYHHLL